MGLGEIVTTSIGAGFGALAAKALLAPYSWWYAPLAYTAVTLGGAIAGGSIAGALYSGGKGH